MSPPGHLRKQKPTVLLALQSERWKEGPGTWTLPHPRPFPSLVLNSTTGHKTGIGRVLVAANEKPQKGISQCLTKHQSQ